MRAGLADAEPALDGFCKGVSFVVKILKLFKVFFSPANINRPLRPDYYGISVSFELVDKIQNFVVLTVAVFQSFPDSGIFTVNKPWQSEIFFRFAISFVACQDDDVLAETLPEGKLYRNRVAYSPIHHRDSVDPLNRAKNGHGA